MELSVINIQNKIYEIRGQKVMIDRDLAQLYQVETRTLNQAVRRNISRFPEDFMFQLTREEYNSLKSQFVILEKGRGKHTKFNPLAFTEQGVAMLSSVLNSERAIQTNILIIRSFVLLRQYALNYKELQDKIEKLERKYNKDFKKIFEALDYLLEEKQKAEDFENRTPIGFKIK
ncbi:MAG: ORF6N domain-containing protein [Chitinophagaceae bacterium]|nr:ORF6N domain-containing protein [Chitinophagaceae bacterium]